MNGIWVNGKNADLEKAGLFRRLKSAEYGPGRQVIFRGKAAIDFASNDYLGLRNHPEVIDASLRATRRYGAGGGASRLICGNHPLYDTLEKEVARFKGCASALIFSSGYALNISVIAALAGRGDAVILDRLDHASLIDGARLSGAKLLIYPHADMEGLEKTLKSAAKYGRRLVVTDSVFSMDGDIAPLTQIHALALEHGAMLMVDEAHATGVVGPRGRGVAEQQGLNGKIDVVMGTFSKAFGSLGAYAACSREMRAYLVNAARGLIFTTALPPGVLAASLAALRIAARADDRRSRLFENGRRLKQGLRVKGFDPGGGETPIIPVLIGDEKKAVRAADDLLKQGFFVPAVRYPAVRKGQARLRLCISSEHSFSDIDGLAAAMGKVIP
jgi:8-amino-7-oxononanoate synthase